MAENKADKALKQANYKIKLLLESDSEHESKAIDITAPIAEVMQGEDLYRDLADAGIAYRIVGLYETSDDSSTGFTASTPLGTRRADEFLRQEIFHIIDAAIVNAKQSEAVKMLISNAFVEKDASGMREIEYILSEHVDEL